MRLLYRRHDHAGAGAAGENHPANGGADPGADAAQSLPLRHPYAYSRRHPPRRRGDAFGSPGGACREGPAMTANLSRRAFLAATGALTVSFATRVQAQSADAASKLPGSLKDTPRLAGLVQVAPDGAVTVFTGKAELGQGIRTALIQVAAEQLYLAPDQVTLVTADTGTTPNEGYTAGSHSMQDSGTAIMNAAAEVRGILVAEAASRLGVAAAGLTTRGGRIAAPDGSSLGFGELVSSLAPDRLAQPNAPLVDPAAYTVMGKPFPRVDIPAKVTGG